MVYIKQVHHPDTSITEIIELIKTYAMQYRRLTSENKIPWFLKAAKSEKTYCPKNDKKTC